MRQWTSHDIPGVPSAYDREVAVGKIAVAAAEAELDPPLAAVADFEYTVLVRSVESELGRMDIVVDKLYTGIYAVRDRFARGLILYRLAFHLLNRANKPGFSYGVHSYDSSL